LTRSLPLPVLTRWLNGLKPGVNKQSQSTFEANAARDTENFDPISYSFQIP